MVNPSNPFVKNCVWNLIEDPKNYGVDLEGPSPFKNSDSNVTLLRFILLNIYNSATICKGSGLESSSKPGELYMNTNSKLINENSAKTGIIMRLC